MAALGVLYVMLEIFLDDEHDILQFWSLRNSTIGQFIAQSQFASRRPYLPRITGFAEDIIIPQFNSGDFKYHFRLSREMFEEILVHIGHRLASDHCGGLVETEPTKQLLIYTCYMANTESMREVSLCFNVGLATVHIIIGRTCRIIIECLANVIRWPSSAEQQVIATRFHLNYMFPHTVGVFDGTHIRLSSCPGGDPDYINRKWFPSMQLQVVCDDTLLTNIYTGWPGNTHDARVLRNSELFTRAEAGSYINHDKLIIGDSAYPLKPWLVTPFRDNGRLTLQQRRFNRVLSSGRQVVERCIGHLKGRFRRLREIPVHEPEDIVSIIVSGCILHNLCIIHKNDVEKFVEEDGNGHPNNYPNLFRNDVNGINRSRRLQIMAGLP